MGDFYGTGIEIWDGFGPIGITEKKNILELWGQFFQVFVGKKKVNKKHCSVSTKKLKLHEIKGYFFLNNQNLKKKILGWEKLSML